MDIVRTKAQVYTQYGAIDTFKYIMQRDGPRGLMTGVSAVRLMAVGGRQRVHILTGGLFWSALQRVLANVPSGVLVITSYEFVKRMSRKTPEELAAARSGL